MPGRLFARCLDGAHGRSRSVAALPASPVGTDDDLGRPPRKSWQFSFPPLGWPAAPPCKRRDRQTDGVDRIAGDGASPCAQQAPGRAGAHEDAPRKPAGIGGHPRVLLAWPVRLLVVTKAPEPRAPHDAVPFLMRNPGLSPRLLVRRRAAPVFGLCWSRGCFLGRGAMGLQSSESSCRPPLPLLAGGFQIRGPRFFRHGGNLRKRGVRPWRSKDRSRW